MVALISSAHEFAGEIDELLKMNLIDHRLRPITPKQMVLQRERCRQLSVH